MAKHPHPSKNLQLLLKTFKLKDVEFVDQFLRTTGTGLRADAVHGWLSGERSVYKGNLEHLAAYWRTYIPSFERSYLLLPPDDFAKIIAVEKDADPAIGGVVLDLNPALVSDDQINRLCGSYRVFRYYVNEARIVSEALSIARRTVGNKPVLDATLWSPTAKEPQVLRGTVIVMGGNVYVALYDVDPASPVMRFLNLTDQIGSDRGITFGLASGVFDAQRAMSAMGIAVEKKSMDPAVAAKEGWVRQNATSDIPTTVLVALQRPLPPT